MFYVPLAQTVELHQSDDAAARVPVALRARPDARHGPAARRRSNRGEAGARGRRSEPDRHLLRTLQEQVDRSFDQQRAVASLAGLFGLVALVLAAIGLYGMTAYTVAQRTNEIGIRMALGADQGNVVGHGAAGGVPARRRSGLTLGLPLAVGAGYLLSAQLYNVKFWDPLALGVGAASLATCAFFAAIIPARRAASISPIRALRT